MNYLYNGVELPALPEWDKTANPYVVVWHYLESDTWQFYVGSVRPFYSTGDINGINRGSYIFAFASAAYHLNDGVWELAYTYANGVLARMPTETHPVIYTNADVLDDNGAVYKVAGTTTDPNMPPKPADPVSPVPKGVTHCWYSSMLLPVLPEWDIRVYPYVFLGKNPGDAKDEVIASRYPLKYGEDASGGLHINTHYKADTDSWKPWAAPGASGTMNGTQLWANYDVYDDDGVLQLHALELVPDGEPEQPDQPDEPETTTPDFAIIPCADYKAACDAIRAKTGKTDLIKSGDMASDIGAIYTGGNIVNPDKSGVIKFDLNARVGNYKSGTINENAGWTVFKVDDVPFRTNPDEPISMRRIGTTIFHPIPFNVDDSRYDYNKSAFCYTPLTPLQSDVWEEDGIEYQCIENPPSSGEYFYDFIFAVRTDTAEYHGLTLDKGVYAVAIYNCYPFTIEILPAPNDDTKATVQNGTLFIENAKVVQNNNTLEVQ